MAFQHVGFDRTFSMLLLSDGCDRAVTGYTIVVVLKLTVGVWTS